MGKILIYYKYVEIADPKALMDWQRELCTRLELKGRILIAHEGINGTVGGSIEATEQYKKEFLAHLLFSDVDIKESEGSAEHFPRLMIKVKKEIVNLGLDTKTITAKDAGRHLTPQEVHELLAKRPENLVLIDTRNDYESRVGTFQDAIKPDTRTFREFPKYIEDNLDQFKDKQVLMFCTAGVRCERASAFLKLKGVAQEVMQMDGGIHRYVEQFPDGFFRGKNYVFDARVTTKVTEEIFAQCEHCNITYDDYTNCINAECNRQIIVCPTCITSYHNTCSPTCLELVNAKSVVIRTAPKKIDITTGKRI